MVGILQNKTPEALENTKRLQKKMEHNLDKYFYFDFDEQKDAETLIVSFGISSRASVEAALLLRKKGDKISLLTVKTLLPVHEKIYEIISRYKKVFVVEENLTGQYRQILFGTKSPAHIKGINGIGEMISPIEIMEEITNG